MDASKNPYLRFVRKVGEMAEYEVTTPAPIVDRAKGAEYAIRMAKAFAIPPQDNKGGKHDR